jgi:phosphate transport system ATP-binding protein
MQFPLPAGILYQHQEANDAMKNADQKPHPSGRSESSGEQIPSLLTLQVSEEKKAVPTEFKRKIEVQHLNFFYGVKQALFDVSLPLPEHQVMAFIGPSGCGKSTFLRTLNRMDTYVPGTRIEGKAWFEGQDLYAPTVDHIHLRQRIGMVFQRPNPFPDSLFENVAFGLRVLGLSRRSIVERVEESLRGAALWEEVKDRLHTSAQKLSGGQQQRLCIARAIAPHPEVLLMDEPCSALDPIATLRVEELITTLASEYSIVLVTHNMQQAARVSHSTGFFLQGRLVEWAPTVELFRHPQQQETEDYISGRFG